jgi:hypothetical protein
MNLKQILFTALWISMLITPYSAQARDEAILQGFLGVMKEMQKQSGADADPNGRAIIDAFGKAIDGKADRRQGREDRQRQGKGREDRQRQGKSDGRQAETINQRRLN